MALRAVNRFFLDTEFSNRGSQFPIEIISFALVAEDGRELYLVARDCDFNKESCNEFVKTYVLPRIIDEPRTPVSDFAEKIIQFVGSEQYTQFVGYFSAIDWTLFIQLFHTRKFPLGWNNFCIDIAQLRYLLGRVRLPRKPEHSERHSAIIDARWTKSAFFHVEDLLRQVRLR